MFSHDESQISQEDEEGGDMSSSRPFNQRIDLTLLDDEADRSFVAEETSVGGDMDDEELTRDKVKRASQQILLAVDRKKRKPKKRDGRGSSVARHASFENN